MVLVGCAWVLGAGGSSCTGGAVSRHVGGEGAWVGKARRPCMMGRVGVEARPRWRGGMEGRAGHPPRIAVWRGNTGRGLAPPRRGVAGLGGAGSSPNAGGDAVGLVRPGAAAGACGGRGGGAGQKRCGAGKHRYPPGLTQPLAHGCPHPWRSAWSCRPGRSGCRPRSCSWPCGRSRPGRCSRSSWGTRACAPQASRGSSRRGRGRRRSRGCRGRGCRATSG